MKKALVAFAALLSMASVASIGAGVARAAGEPKWILHTEDYPPYQTKGAKGGIDGENVKIVKEIMKKAGLAYELKMDTWDKSFETAKKKAYNGVFTAIRNGERESLFQWVGPISVTRWVLLAKKSKKIEIKEVADAFKFKIGGYQNDAKSQYLEKLGGVVDKVDDDAKNAKRLDKGEIDLWATGYISGMKHAKDQGITDLEEVFVYREDYGYLALNVDTKQSVVLNLNRIVEQLKDKGVIKVKFK